VGLKIDLFRNETDGVSFAAGQVIFTEGEVGTSMYVVLEGQVELKIRGKFVETLEPGELFGEMALIDHTPRVATAVAKTDCKLAAVPEKRFLFMVQQTPHFALHVMRVMAERIRKMDDRS
jgi:CRP-like cAMP-binding protein